MGQTERKLEKLKRILEDNQYKYDIPEEIYSDVKCMLHEIRFNKRLPGRDALKETLMFLKIYKRKGYSCELCYELALEVALHKVENRRFDRKDGKKGIIQTVKDVEQVMGDSLEQVGIRDSVKEFICSRV